MTSASAGRTKHLFVLATGLGKTTVASALADRFFQRGYRKILVLCHAVDLAAQLQREFWKQLSRDIPTRIFTDGEPPVPIEGVNFGLYQTMYNYLGGIEKGSFDLIIVDEAHHALGNAFTLCVEHLAPRLLIGMTATPWRGDGRRVEDLFGEPQVTLSLVDGMKMGYLAQVDYRLMCDNIDWGQLADLAGRPVSIKELNKRIFLPQRDDAVIDEIVKLGSEVKHPRIAVFSPSVSHAEEFAIKLNARGVKAANLSIPDKVRRRSLLMEFSAGGLSAITAVDVLNEGIDVPEVNVVVFLRATHSRRIFVQQLGRGLRIAPGKERVVVLDFVSDLRRLSALHQMQGEFTKALKSRPEQIWLPVEVVSFSSVRTRAFVDAWLNDGEDIQDADEQSSITFPEIV
jgi:superfamily II DNA or RNA helicase